MCLNVFSDITRFYEIHKVGIVLCGYVYMNIEITTDCY